MNRKEKVPGYSLSSWSMNTNLNFGNYVDSPEFRPFCFGLKFPCTYNLALRINLVEFIFNKCNHFDRLDTSIFPKVNQEYHKKDFYHGRNSQEARFGEDCEQCKYLSDSFLYAPAEYHYDFGRSQCSRRLSYQCRFQGSRKHDVFWFHASSGYRIEGLRDNRKRGFQVLRVSQDDWNGDCTFGQVTRFSRSQTKSQGKTKKHYKLSSEWATQGSMILLAAGNRKKFLRFYDKYQPQPHPIFDPIFIFAFQFPCFENSARGMLDTKLSIDFHPTHTYQCFI